MSASIPIRCISVDRGIAVHLFEIIERATQRIRLWSAAVAAGLTFISINTQIYD
jgi:hypothetical protein